MIEKKGFLLTVNRSDNVATVVGADINLPSSYEILGAIEGSLNITEPISFGHKSALVDFYPGDKVIKYGVVIGQISKYVAAGGHVHIHNMESLRGRGDLKSKL